MWKRNLPKTQPGPFSSTCLILNIPIPLPDPPTGIRIDSLSVEAVELNTYEITLGYSFSFTQLNSDLVVNFESWLGTTEAPDRPQPATIIGPRDRSGNISLRVRVEDRRKNFVLYFQV